MTDFTTYRGVRLLTDDEIDNFVKTLRHIDVDDLFTNSPESFEARAIATIFHLEDQVYNSYDDASYEDSWEEPDDYKEERLYEE